MKTLNVVWNQSGYYVNATELSPGQQYYAQVGAWDQENQITAWSETTIFETTLSNPVLNVDNISANQARMTWNSISGAASYSTNYRLASGGSWIYTGDVATTYKWLTGLSPGTAYYGLVGAKTAKGTHYWSNQKYFVTATTTTTTTTLGNPYYRIRIINNDEDDFTGASGTYPVYYRLRNSGTGSYTEQYSVQVPRYSTIYTPARQVSSGSYQSFIQWYDPDVGSWSSHLDDLAARKTLDPGTTTYFEKTIPFNTSTTTTTTTTTLLAAPQVEVGATSAKVDWAVAYKQASGLGIPLDRLSHRIHDDATWNNIDGVKDVSQYVLKDLDPGQTYDVRVGNPKVSPPLWTAITWFTVTTTSTTTTTMPPPKIRDVTTNSALVYWDPVPGATSYSLYTIRYDGMQQNITSVGTSTQATRTGLDSNTNYYATYRYYIGGVEYQADPTMFTTKLLPAPTVVPEGTSASVTWPQYSTSATYQLGHIKSSGLAAWTWKDVGASESGTISDLTPSTGYYCKYKATDGNVTYDSQQAGFQTLDIPMSKCQIRILANQDDDPITVNWQIYQWGLAFPALNQYGPILYKSGSFTVASGATEVKSAVIDVEANKYYRSRIWWNDPDADAGTVFESDDADNLNDGWVELPPMGTYDLPHPFGHTISKYPLTISSSITFKNEDDDNLSVDYTLTKFADQTATLGQIVKSGTIAVPAAEAEGIPGQAQVPGFTQIDPGWYVLSYNWLDPDATAEQSGKEPISGRRDATDDPLGFGVHFAVTLPRVTTTSTTTTTITTPTTITSTTVPTTTTVTATTTTTLPPPEITALGNDWANVEWQTGLGINLFGYKEAIVENFTDISVTDASTPKGLTGLKPATAYLCRVGKNTAQGPFWSAAVVFQTSEQIIPPGKQEPTLKGTQYDVQFMPDSGGAQ